MTSLSPPTPSDDAKRIYERMHDQCWCSAVGNGTYQCDDCSRIEDALDEYSDALLGEREAHSATRAENERLSRIVNLGLALAEEAWGLCKAVIVVKPTLDHPYPDDERWTPWTRFVERPASATARARDEFRAALSSKESNSE